MSLAKHIPITPNYPIGQMPTIPATKDRRKIALPVLEGIHFELIVNITHLAAEGNYTMLYFTANRHLLVCKTLREIEALISCPRQFVRIHRSYTINLDFLQKYIRGKGGAAIMDCGKSLSISASRKAAFLAATSSYFKKGES